MAQGDRATHATRADWSWLFLYFALLVNAEVLTTFVSSAGGVGLHALLLLALVFHAARLKSRFRDLFLAMTLLPVIRILSLTMPIWLADSTLRFPLINVPLILSVLVAGSILGYRRADLGLRIGRLSIQMAVALTGVAIGLIEARLIQPPGLAASAEAHALLWPVLSLLLFTGLSEELLFRGLLQRAAVRVLGAAPGIAYAAILFGAMHVGWQSILDVVFVTAVGLLFGVIVHRTRSILGVTLAHGLANVVLFVALPLGRSGF